MLVDSGLRLVITLQDMYMYKYDKYNCKPDTALDTSPQLGEEEEESQKKVNRL